MQKKGPVGFIKGGEQQACRGEGNHNQNHDGKEMITLTSQRERLQAARTVKAGKGVSRRPALM